MQIVLKSGSLNLLAPSRSVQACNGIALFWVYTIFLYGIKNRFSNLRRGRSPDDDKPCVRNVSDIC
jgi:hypothetical protein